MLDVLDDDIVLSESSSSSHSKLKLSSSSKGRTTSRRKPKKHTIRTDVDPDFPCFDTLPDELVIKIHTYLDPPTLGRTAQCCKRFNTVCTSTASHHPYSSLQLSSDVPLWRDMSGRGDWTHKRNPLTQSVTKSYYVQKFLSFRRQTKIREQMEQEELRRKRYVHLHSAGGHIRLSSAYN